MEPEYEAAQIIETPPEDEVIPAPALEKRVWGPWITVGFSLAIGFVILIAQVAMVVIMMSTGLDIESMLDTAMLEEFLRAKLPLMMGVGTLISGVIGVAGIVGVIKLRRGASIAEYLGLRRISLKRTALLLLVALAMIAALDGLGTLMADTVETGFDAWMFDTSGWPVLVWLAVVLFAPLQEEVLFRGFLFEGLRYSRLGAAGTIVLTSLLWASLHVQYSLFLMAGVFLMGLLLGYVRLRTNSLWGPLLIHAVNNLVAMLLMSFNMQNLFQW